MKKHIILFVVTLFLMNNFSLAVNVSTADEFNALVAQFNQWNGTDVTIKLLENIEINSLKIDVWGPRTFSIDGNNKTLTVKEDFDCGQNDNVYIKDVTLNAKNLIIHNQNATFEVSNSVINISNNLTADQNPKIEFNNVELNVDNKLDFHTNGTVDFTNSTINTFDFESRDNSTTINLEGTLNVKNVFGLSGGSVKINIPYGTNVIVQNTDMGTQTTINVSGYFESETLSVYSGSSHLNVKNGGAAKILGDGSVTNGADFSVEKGGVLQFKGDFVMRDGANMTLTGDMEVYGNMDINYGTSVIDGTLNVANELRIYYDNNNQGQPNITGTGKIAAKEFYCKDNNATSGEDCVNQLSSYFNVNNIQRGNVVMPIVLSAFTAVSQQNHVNVCWTTESEQNNDYFTIYRSADGENFEQIGTEAGAGNSTMTLNYSFVDYYPLDGVSYYLLQQTDYDGTSKYSKKVVVKRSLSVEPCMVKVFPNPYKNDDGLTIDLGSSNNANVQVQIVDAMGKVVSNVSCKTIGSAMRINPKLNAGVYMVKVSVDGQTSTQKLVVE